MSRMFGRVAVVIGSLFLPERASAQTADHRPDLRVRFDRPAEPSAWLTMAARASRRGAPVDGLGINVHGGFGIHSSGGLLDDACDVINRAYDLEAIDSANCGGSGGDNLVTFGAFLSYAKSVGTTRLQFQGGYHFTPENEIRLETDGVVSDFNADFALTNGYRFTSQAFYGGAGVELGDLYVGGAVGLVRHSGEEFASALLRFNGVVYEQFDDERARSGTSPMFGVRAMYSLRPGIRAYADWYTYGVGELHDSFEGGTPVPLPVPASPVLSARDRVFGFGVAVDVFSFYK